jgi:hypothetical protein
MTSTEHAIVIAPEIARVLAATVTIMAALVGIGFFEQRNPIGLALGHTLGWSSAPGGQIEQDQLVALLERERLRRSDAQPSAVR